MQQRMCRGLPVAVCAAVLALVCGSPASADIPPLGSHSPASAAVEFVAATNTYSLRALSVPPVTYSIDVSHPDVVAGLLRIDAAVGTRTPLTVVARAGTRYRNATGTLLEPEALAALGTTTLVEHRLDGDAVVLRYSERPGTHDLERTFRLSLRGTTLVLQLQSSATWGNDGYAGISLGSTDGTPGARAETLPFLPEPIALLPDGTYLSAYVDRTLSSGSWVGTNIGPRDATSVYAHGVTRSDLDTAGRVVPLDETAYVTASENLSDVFPASDLPASSYRADLSRRVVLDVWGQHSAFGVEEGVALVWRVPAAAVGRAHVTVAYASGGGTCGDGVQLVLATGPAPRLVLDTDFVPSGDTTSRVREHDVDFTDGMEFRAEVHRGGSNSCDGTSLRLTIAAADGDTYDSVTDFSSTQGQRGFHYLELVGTAESPMTWSAADGQWRGRSPYSILAAGFAHPGQGLSSYRDGTSMVGRLVEYGLRELAIIFHVWQLHGYDEGLPDHHPANPDGGTGEELAGFAAAAREAGMLLALHENYTDMYPDAPPDNPSPLFDATAIALDGSGARKLGWLNEGTGQQAFRIAADRMLDFSQLESPSIAADYAPNAAYLDVNPGWNPSIAIDFSAAGHAPSMAASYRAHVALYDFLRESYAGPLFGEGGEGSERFDSYYAGSVDAVERQIEGRAAARVAPDFELRAVKPGQLNHGLGYYCRYFVPSGQSTVAFADADLDQYRAGEIAFGHAGFLGDCLSGASPAQLLRAYAREYWLVQALQARYADASPASITYDDGGTAVDLGTALRNGLDLVGARLTVEYESGLTVLFNRDSSLRATGTVAGFSSEQGANGFRYLEEDLAGTRTPMTWNASLHRWQGARPYSLLHEWGGHPDGGAVVRTWTSPVAATVQVRGNASDGDGGCGDGVDVQILQDDVAVWSQTIENGDDVGADFDLSLAVAPGSVLAFRIFQRADNFCDSTAFASTLSYDDGADHSWTVTLPTGPLVLPPSGFAAHGLDGFVAWSALQGGRRADWVSAPEYVYAGTRGTDPATIGTVVTDGAIAFVSGPDGESLHGTALTQADRDGVPALRSTPRADVNIRVLDPRRALVTVRYPGTGRSADVTWSRLPPAWVSVLAVHPDEVERVEADGAGTPTGTPLALAASGSDLPLGTFLADQHYLVRMTSECVVEVECAAGEGCIEGRCVPGAADADADADGDADAADGDADDAAEADADGGDTTGDIVPDGGSGDDGGGCGCRAAGPVRPAFVAWLLVLAGLVAFGRRLAVRRSQ